MTSEPPIINLHKHPQSPRPLRSVSLRCSVTRILVKTLGVEVRTSDLGTEESMLLMVPLWLASPRGPGMELNLRVDVGQRKG